MTQTPAHHLVFLPIASVNEFTSILRGIPTGAQAPIPPFLLYKTSELR